MTRSVITLLALLQLFQNLIGEKANLKIIKFSASSLLQGQRANYVLKYEFDFYDYYYLLNHNILIELGDEFSANFNTDVTCVISIDGHMDGVTLVSRIRENRLFIRVPFYFGYEHYSSVRNYMNNLGASDKIKLTVVIIDLLNPSVDFISSFWIRFYNACNNKLVHTHHAKINFEPDTRNIEFLVKSLCAFVPDGHYSAPVILTTNQKLSRSLKVIAYSAQPGIEISPSIFEFEAGEISLKKFRIIPLKKFIEINKSSELIIKFELLSESKKPVKFPELALEVLSFDNLSQMEKYRNQPKICFPVADVYPSINHFNQKKLTFPINIRLSHPFAYNLTINEYKNNWLGDENIKIIPKNLTIHKGQKEFNLRVCIKDYKYVEFRLDHYMRLYDSNTFRALDMKNLFEKQLKTTIQESLVNIMKTTKNLIIDFDSWTDILTDIPADEEFFLKYTLMESLPFYFFVNDKIKNFELLNLKVDHHDVFTRTRSLNQTNSISSPLKKFKGTNKKFFAMGLKRIHVTSELSITGNEHNQLCVVLFRKHLLSSFKSSKRIIQLYERICRDNKGFSTRLKGRVVFFLDKEIGVSKSTSEYAGQQFVNLLHFDLPNMDSYYGLAFIRTQKPQSRILNYLFDFKPKKEKVVSPYKTLLFKSCMHHEELLDYLANSANSTMVNRGKLYESMALLREIHKNETRYFVQPFQFPVKQSLIVSLKEKKCDSAKKKTYAIYWNGSRSELMQFVQDKLKNPGMTEADIINVEATASLSRLKPVLRLNKVRAKWAEFKFLVKSEQLDMLFNFELTFTLFIKNSLNRTIQKVQIIKPQNETTFQQTIYHLNPQRLKKLTPYWIKLSTSSLVHQLDPKTKSAYMSVKIVNLKDTHFYKFYAQICLTFDRIKYRSCGAVKTGTNELVTHNALKNIVFISGSSMLSFMLAYLILMLTLVA